MSRPSPKGLTEVDDMKKSFPDPHPDPYVDATRPYVMSVVQALLDHGISVPQSWLDPRDPRDATITLGHLEATRPDVLYALVWDEETGWRRGIFRSGQPGIRTVLDKATTLAGQLLPPGEQVAMHILSNTRSQPRMFRSHRDLHDGFEARLRQAWLPQRVDGAETTRVVAT